MKSQASTVYQDSDTIAKFLARSHPKWSRRLHAKPFATCYLKQGFNVFIYQNTVVPIFHTYDKYVKVFNPNDKISLDKIDNFPYIDIDIEIDNIFNYIYNINDTYSILKFNYDKLKP